VALPSAVRTWVNSHMDSYCQQRLNVAPHKAVLVKELSKDCLIDKANLVQVGMKTGVIVEELIGHCDLGESHAGMLELVLGLARHNILDRFPTQMSPV
jgi:hypothetical protein